MQCKPAAFKSRSPTRFDSHYKDQIIEKCNNFQQTLKAFITNRGKLAKNELKDVFSKRARSNSPKGMAKNMQNLKMLSKCKSPVVKDLGMGSSRNRGVIISQKIMKTMQSPSRVQSKINTDRSYKRFSTQRITQQLESEGLQRINSTQFLAKMKHTLNKELWEAAENGNIAKINLLFDSKNELKPDIDSAGIENRTALHCAAYENRPEAVKLLLKHGASPNARTVHQRTPLHIACILGEENVCRILLDAGAAVNAQDFEKNTPTHYAAFYRSVGVKCVDDVNTLKILLGKNVDLTIKNKKGQTAIDVSNSKSVVALFLSYLKMDSEGVKENRANSSQKKTLNRRWQNGAQAKTTQKYYIEPKPEFISAPDSTGSISSKRLIELPTHSTSRDLTVEDSSIGLSSFAPIRLLGKGSFGQVYLVKRKGTDRYYALKAQLKSMVVAQNLHKYVYTEKNVQSKISHNFIVRLHCAFQTKSRLFTVMDYCRGGDLGSLLQRERRLSVDRARIYTCEILLAIEELHRHDIIYRDLKPDNVVIDEQGHVLLTDFGLSKQGMKETDFTQSFCGSVAYLAPEVLHRVGHSRTVDWYLLGVLLYEMLVGVPPYFDRNKYKLFDNIKRGPLQVPCDIPRDALDLIVKLLNRDPKKRLGAGPGDAEEIKKHPFFKGIDWKEVLERKLKPPKPSVKPVVEREETFHMFKELEEDDGESKMERWTFIAQDFV